MNGKKLGQHISATNETPNQKGGTTELTTGAGIGGVLVYLVSLVPPGAGHDIMLYAVPGVSLVATKVVKTFSAALVDYAKFRTDEILRRRILKDATAKLNQAEKMFRNIEQDANATQKHKDAARARWEALQEAVFALHAEGALRTVSGSSQADQSATAAQ